MVTVVILSAAKDLTERSDTDRVAGARSFAALRTTGSKAIVTVKISTRSGELVPPLMRLNGLTFVNA